MTEAADKSGIAQAPPHMRRGLAERDEHASILKGLARVDWLVLLVVALYTLALGAPAHSSRALYAALAAYTLFVVAFRWRGFPVRATGARIALGAAAMVAFITVVAANTGGASSPMTNLYLLPIVVVAMTLGRQGTLVVFAAVTLALIAWFVTLTRFEPSILRAGVMAGLSATAYVRGVERPPIRLLALAVTGLVLIDPLLVWSVGFWLSVQEKARRSTTGRRPKSG